MDPYTGEIIVMAGKTIDKATGEVSDYASGNYLDANKIGSTIKGGSIYTGFKEGVIGPNTYLLMSQSKLKEQKLKSLGNLFWNY